jgi:hypothetical protein
VPVQLLTDTTTVEVSGVYGTPLHVSVFEAVAAHVHTRPAGRHWDFRGREVEGMEKREKERYLVSQGLSTKQICLSVRHAVGQERLEGVVLHVHGRPRIEDGGVGLSFSTIMGHEKVTVHERRGVRNGPFEECERAE